MMPPVSLPYGHGNSNHCPGPNSPAIAMLPVHVLNKALSATAIKVFLSIAQASAPRSVILEAYRNIWKRVAAISQHRIGAGDHADGPLVGRAERYDAAKAGIA